MRNENKKTEATKAIKAMVRDAPETLDVLATEIINISHAMRALNSSRLKRRVIELLLSDASDVRITDVKTILDAAEQLDAKFLKKV